ncbi:MAG: excinuclease ABC subunit UvrC [Gammaproteobacteria bacterium]|nr:excinuclease ABC subunit UvrC [Gammaproteobacteria bacterium]MDX2486190.1 excinuclease ABC subunit UvrC [Gammaproteobacteria bacterium]
MTDKDSQFNHKGFLKTLTAAPGVYQMYDVNDKLLYVGKARNLKKRLTSYFRKTGLSLRIDSMIRQVSSIEVSLTHTETEALLLESNLIKSLKPRFNILMRDDKSYPYIRLTINQDYPGLSLHRGSRKDKAEYFGPFPSAGAVRELLALLQKTIPVRQCEDGFYRNRSRPCLQYQIKRCTAPCVGLIDKNDYARDIQQAVLFINGQKDSLAETLAESMAQASAKLEFELAAELRDRISRVRQIQTKQYVSGKQGDFDIIVQVQEEGSFAIGVMFIRAGRSLGTKVLFPRFGLEQGEGEMLSAFIAQFYINKPPARLILLPIKLDDAEVLSAALTERAGFRVRIASVHRGDKRRWLDSVRINASDAVRRRLATESNYRERLNNLVDVLNLPEIPERIECIDISHTQGEATVASLVVFGDQGPLNGQYRRYNIEGITPGDDYAAIHQALSRRFRRMQEKGEKYPDLLLIDGGKGQLSSACDALGELGVSGVITVGVAKGKERKAGWERLFRPGEQTPVMLPPDSPALHLVQVIRDEAHRFAITGHRRRRAKARVTSTLEDIPGIGDKKRQALLKHFGGLQGVEKAGVDDLSRVAGINRKLAKRIYDCLH